MDRDDEMLMELAAGNPGAFAVLYNRYSDKVFRFALGFVKDSDTAKEIVQSVFVILWEKHSLLKNVKNLDAYVLSVTRNSIYRYIKTVASRYDLEAPVDNDSRVCSATPQEDLEFSDLRLIVKMVVDGMPDRRKEIFVMSREEGLSNDDIASKLGLSKKTVENQLNLALKAIRNAISALLLPLMLLTNFFELDLGVIAKAILSI